MTENTATPCCGTAQAAAEAGACCDPAARTAAVTAGADCCGAAAETASMAGEERSGATEVVSQTGERLPAVVVGAGPMGQTGAGPVGQAGERLPVVVVGAGPVGLAAAAHLHERGLAVVVLEAGSAAGAAVAEWGHVRVFSPWRYNIDHAAGRLLDAAGWARPDPDLLPTGAELVEQYLQPLAKLPQLAPHIRYDARVTAIGRVGVDRVRTAGREQAPFVVRLADGTEVQATAVIDASGTWRTPNVLGANGLPAHGEQDAAALIASALPDVLGGDREHYAGRHTVVVGAGHSAATTLLALAELAEQEPGTRITWATRGGSIDRAVGGGDADALPARGALGTGIKRLVTAGRVELVTGFAVARVEVADGGAVFTAVDGRTVAADGRAVLTAVDGRTVAADGRAVLTAVDGRTVAADRIVSATGFRPDHTIAEELRLDLDPALGCTRALAPLIDPNEHSCGTVRPHGVDELTQPEPGYYAVGMKAYGRAPTFLMATGYEQVRSIAAALAGDWADARDVQLDLPETGVCSSSAALTAGSAPSLALIDLSEGGGGCCG